MRKKLIAILIAGAVLALASWHGQAEQARMDEYAKANGCSWHYDYYLTEQPICR